MAVRQSAGTAVQKKAFRYVRNVGKSLGYITFDMVKASSLGSGVISNADTIKDLYHDIKDFKSSPSDRIKSNQKIMSYSNDIKTGINNLMSDIKSGEWYNQSRQDDAMAKIMGLDFDWGDLDFNFDDMDEEGATTAATLEGTEKEIAAMDIVGSRVSAAVGSATAKSAEYIVNANAESTRAMMNQNGKMFNMLSTGMVGINKTLGDIANMAQPLTLHLQNSATFYTKSTENQAKILELLEKIESNTRKPVEKKGSKQNNIISMDDYISDGMLNIGSLISNAKKNAKTSFDDSMIGMLFSMSDVLGEGSITKMFASNPIGSLATLILPSLIVTDDLRKSLNKFSKALEAASYKALRDLTKHKNSWDHPVLGFISSLFGFSEGRGEIKARPEDYEKGAVSFDGYTKQAITKVIPEYLSMILAALDKNEQKMYDYEKGKFTTRKNIREDIDKEFKRSISSASYDFKTAATKDKSKSSRISISSLIDKYVGNAIKTNNLIEPGMNISPSDYSKYGFKNEEELSRFLSLIKEVEGSDEFWPEIALLNHNIHAARIRNEKSSYDQMSSAMYLYDNSEYKASINSAINNMQNIGGRRGRSARKAAQRAARAANASDAAAAAGAAESYARVISKFAVEEEMRDEGISEDSVVFQKISKEAEKLERKFNSNAKVTDKEIEDFEKLLDDAISNKGSNAVKKIDSVKGFMGKLRNFIGAPLDAVRGILDKGTETLKRLMYGKEGEEDDKSILGHIFINMKQLFTDFKDWTKETIFDPIKKRLDEEGGIVKLLFKFFGIDEEKQKRLNKIKKDVKDRFRSVGNWVLDNNFITQQYRKYKTRKASRQAAENWRSYAEGDPFAEGPDESGFGSGLSKLYAKKYKGGASQTEEDKKPYGERTFNAAKDAFTSFFQAIIPSKKDLSKDLEKAGDTLKTTFGAVKDDPSGAITGALLGAGVSILTGGIIGPFIGAAMGGAAGITINSETVQKALFGEDVVDEKGNKTGEKKGGLLSAKISTFLTRDLNKIAGYGLNGAIVGLLPFIPGGPITGLLVGSAIGFANRNGEVANKLFGTMGENGERTDDGFLSKELQEKIKHLLPKATIGAALGLIGGPFGLAGNLILGAGLGFISETERFKSIIFGEEDSNGERKDGIAGWIRKDIVKPISEAIMPIAVEIKNKGTDIIRWTIRSISNVFGKIVAMPISEKIKNFFDNPQSANTFIGKLAGAVGWGISLPFRTVGSIGRGLRRKQIRTGRANDMTAKARLEYRNEKGLGPDEFTDFDTILAGMDDSEINDYLNGIRNARKSKDQEAIDSEVNKFKTKFGLQNVKVTDKNIDKYLDNLSSEKRRRKEEKTKLSPDEVRNQLIESHSIKIENMVGAIANKFLGYDAFKIDIPGLRTQRSEGGEENSQIPQVLPGTTRRSFGTVVKSIFNPFTGMDMESVRAAINYYEDNLDGNVKSYSSAQRRELATRVKKIEVNGQFRDDIIQVTDKNGYSVVVQKVNGTWMPYKVGKQLAESLADTKLGRVIPTIKKVGKAAANVIRTLSGNPFFGLDTDIVLKAKRLFFEKKDMTLSDIDKPFYDAHVRELNVEYPGADVIEITDNDGKSAIGRFDWDSNSWKPVTLAWKAKFKAKQAMKAVGNAILKAGSKIKGFVTNVISNIRHINPFCDFEPKEVGPIIRSLNSMEFDGGSDDTGKIRRVKGLMHYYQVTSENGTVVTVTAEMGKWVYVSDKRLQAAKARSITGGLGNLISNTARSLINKIGNRNNAKRGISGAINNIVQGEAPEGAGSDLVRARNYRGSGVLSSLATGFSKLKGMFSSGGDGGLGDIGNTLLGGSGDSKPSDTSSIEAKSIDGLSIGSFLKKINSTKFDPNKYLKTSGENAGKNMSNKEVREAERQKQSTLNIFRQSNFTEEQISRKMDVIISGLFGSSGGGKSKGGVFGIGGLFGNLLSGIAMSALGIGGLMALRDGKFDGLLEGLYGTVNGDNTGTNNTKSKYSSVTATDKKTGKTYQLATKKGKIVEDENGNYVTPDGQILNPEDFTVNYRGSMGFGQKMPYLAFKQFTKHGTTMFSPLRRLAINGLSRIPLLGRPFRGLNNTIDSLAVKGRNKFLEGFSKLPGVNKLVSNIGDSKFGQWLTKMGAKKMSKEAEVLTRNKFNQFFGRNGAKKFKEFQQKGLEQFLTDNPIAAQNAEKLFAEADENLLQKAGKEAGQEGTEKGFKKFLSMFSKETVTETAKEGMEKGTKEVAEEGLEKGAKKAAGITMSEAIKQAASGATEKVAKETLENATEKAAKETLFSTMKDLFESFFKKLSTNKLARKVLGNNVEEFGEEFTQKVVKEAAEKIYAKAGINAAQQAVGAIPIAGWIISVGFAIIEFEENWNRAARIFKVTNPTILERFVAGLVAAVQELIGDLLHFPIDFVPTEWLINGTIWVLEKCGVPFKDLKARQEQAQRELDEFNAKHSDMEPVTFEQWAHMTKAEGGLGESTLGERAFGGIKSAWQNGKVAVKSSWNRSKEQVKGAWEKGKSIAGEAIDRVKEVFDGIKDTFNKVMEVAKSSIGSIFKARQDIMEIARTGDLTKLTDYDTTSAIDKDNPLSGIITAINVIQKLIGYPYTGIAYVGNKIKEKFDQVSGVIKATWDLYTSVDARVAEYSNAGDVKGLVGASIETTEDNPLGGIMKGMLFASKVLRFIPACTTNLSNKVKEKFDQISGVIKATWDLYTSVDAKVMEYSDAGDVKGLVNASIEVDENNPLSGVMKGMLFTSKVLRFVPTGFKYIGNKVHDFISSKVEDVKSNIDSISSEFERMSENAQEGNVLGIWSTPISPYNKLSITGSMFNTANLIGKIFYTLIGLARKLMKPIGEAAEYVGEKVEGAKEWVIEKKDNAVSKVKEVGTNIKEGVTEFGTNTKNFVMDHGVGKLIYGSNYTPSGGSSFVSQVDPSIAGKKFGSLTIGANGCAPSVASMITGAPLDSTAKYALKGGYVDNTGTSADYFSSVLGSAGIPSEFVYTGGNSAVDYLASRISEGSPTVLLGQDPYNTSKANSPFGPGNHYVLATGTTDNGGIVVQDPESNRPNQVYDSSILNSVKLGIPTGSGSRRALRRAIRRFRGGDSASANINGRDKGYSSSMDGYGYNQIAKKNGRDKGYSSSMDGTGYDQVVKNLSRDSGSYVDWTEENALHENLGIWSEISAEELNSWISSHCKYKDSPYLGNGDVILEAAQVSGLDPRYILAHSICESAWGTSNICKNKANYYGIGAFDATPYASSYSFGSSPQWGTKEHFRVGIVEGAKWISTNYYHGAKGTNSHPQCSVWAMQHGREGHRYATSDTWEFTLSKSMASMPANKKCTLSEDPTGTSPGSSLSTSGTSGVSGSTTGSNGSSSSESGGIGSFFTMFKDAVASRLGKLGELFGLTTSNSGSESGSSNGSMGSAGDGQGGTASYNATGYAGTGDYTKVLNVRPGRPNEAQLALVNKMKSIEGTLKYSMSGPRNPDAGSADCSSTVNWAYNKVVGANIGSTTPAIMQTANMSTIDMSDLPASGGTGSGPDLSRLMPGDLVLLSRPTSGFTSGRPYRVGHVEMYMGDGKTIGHGSNGGPRERAIESDKYIMARRFNDFINLDDILNEQNKGSLRDKGFSSTVYEFQQNKKKEAEKNSIRNQGGPSSMEGYKGGASGAIDPAQQSLVDKMKSIAGTIEYSMEGPRDPDQGSADCSSTVGWAYRNVLGIDTGLNTEGILNSPNLTTVDQSDMPITGGTGSGPNLDNIMPGDLILSTRNGNYAKGRPYRVGHVEMYVGDGQTIGHAGPEKGPLLKPIETAKYIMARRANKFVNAAANESSIRNQGYSNSMDMAGNNGIQARINSNNLTSRGYTAANESKNIITPSESTAAPNVLANNTTSEVNSTPMLGSNGFSYNSNLGSKLGGQSVYGKLSNSQIDAMASGSGLLYNIAQDGLNTIRRKHKSSKSAFGGASGLFNLSTYSNTRKAKYYRDLRGGASLIGGDDNKEVLIAMLKGIITLLSNVSANSDKIGDIAGAVNDLNYSSGQTLNTSIDALKNDLKIDDTNETLDEIAKLLNTLAAG